MAQFPSSSFDTSKTKSHSRKEKRSSVMSVKIQPTIGPSFSLSLPSDSKVSTLKEVISDKMGLSPHKISLLLYSKELTSGSLLSNGIEEDSEIRLVPAIESGVTNVNSVDPVAMMKHSMSGISDQQIEDFLSGKSPLSVAIRVGESVVVVNLHRAKVEEIEMEPPPTKRRCMGQREIAVNEINYPDTNMAAAQCSSIRHLNSNSSPSELMDTSEQSTSLQRRSSRLLDRSLRSTRGVSPVSVCEPAPAMVLREPLPKVQEHPSIAAVLGDSTLTESETAASPKKRSHDCAIHRKYSQKGKSKGAGKFCPETTAADCVSPLVSNSTRSHLEVSGKGHSSPGQSSSQATEVDSELIKPSKSHTHLKRSKSSRHREQRHPENGISMKRKAVMDAIGEILKKMYANSDKGRLPGSFKGRFSSEFTCDSSMHEILHSKTTMTSYGGEYDMKDMRGHGSQEPPAHEGPLMSRAQYEETQQLKDKMARIKWKMQYNRAVKKAKRRGERSACGWMENLNCKMPTALPKPRDTFGGLKPGFLLSDSSKV